MAQFKDLVVAGDMRVGGNIYGSEPMKFFYLDSYPTSSNPFIIEDHEPGFYFFKPSSGHTTAYFKLNSDCTGYYYATNCWFIITNNHPEADGDAIGYQEWFGTGRLARTILKRDDSVNSKVSNTGIYYDTGTGNLQNLNTRVNSSVVNAINGMLPVVLFDSMDSPDYGASITLSETAANYDYLEIIFRHGSNNAFKSLLIPSPNGKKIFLDGSYDNGTYLYTSTGTYTINGTTMTRDEEVRWRFATGGGNNTRTTATTNLQIGMVLGFKTFKTT